MGIDVGFFTETASFLRNPGVRRSPSYDGKRRWPDRVKKPVVKIPVDLVTDF